jgi:hypothetical protein
MHKIGCARQRVSCRSKASSSLSSPTSRETSTAAINGPKRTSGLLSGFKITNGQLVHDTGNARRQEEAIKENDVALVILDPVLSVLGDAINDHRAKDVRTALEPLVAVADRTGCLMLAIVHFNKGSGVDAATLLSGSHAFRDLPRAVFAFAATKTEKVLSQVKNSLGRDDLPSLTFAIEPFTVPTPDGPAEVSKFVLGGVSHRDVADLLADATDADDSDLRSAAQDFLLSYLTTNGLAAPASKVIAAGTANGFRADQMKHARARMRDPRVVSGKTSLGGGWEWRIEAPSD